MPDELTKKLDDVAPELKYRVAVAIEALRRTLDELHPSLTARQRVYVTLLDDRLDDVERQIGIDVEHQCVGCDKVAPFDQDAARADGWRWTTLGADGTCRWICAPCARGDRDQVV